MNRAKIHTFFLLLLIITLCLCVFESAEQPKVGVLSGQNRIYAVCWDKRVKKACIFNALRTQVLKIRGIYESGKIYMSIAPFHTGKRT